MDLRTPSRAIAVFSTLAASVLCAQPRIDVVQNNYSYFLPSNPNYGIAPGAIFIIKGANLTDTSVPLQNVPLQKSLNGVTAKVTVNGVSTDVIWYYVFPEQLGAILPSNTPLGTGTITVTNRAGTSAPAAIKVVQSAFGTLTLDGSGTGAAAAFDAKSALLSATNSAKAGDIIVLYGSGLGPAPGDETALLPQINLADLPIEVQVGGLPASVVYHGRTIYPGVDQVNLVVPSGVTPGCSVPLIVKTGAYASNTTTIPVAAEGSTCPPAPPPPNSNTNTTISQAEINSWLAAGVFRTGSVGLTRQTSYSISDNLAGGPPTTTVTREDVLSAGFNRVSGADLPKLFNTQITPPTAGACSVVSGTVVNPIPNLTYVGLDAGPSISVSGPAGTRSAPRSNNSVGQIGYSAKIGTGDTGNYLDVGRYTVTGSGGTDIGSFSGSMDLAPELQWTNRTSLTTVDRTQPLNVTWSGGEPSTLVTIQGTTTLIQGTTVTATSFTCYARNPDRQFTVPASILSQLPASTRLAVGTFSLLQRGTLAVASVGTGARVTASGIDYLTIGNQWGVAQSAEYK